MLKRVIIDKQYVEQLKKIQYFGESCEAGAPDLVHNLGHFFRFTQPSEEEKPFPSERYEVVGRIEQTDDCPYDFILKDLKTEQFYLAILGRRSDGWPLFSVQDEGYICARSRMGSEWNCRFCYKYFGESCKLSSL